MPLRLIPSILAAIIGMTATAASSTQRPDRIHAGLEDSLRSYISRIDARIGVAVIDGGTDTIGVNATERFPMLSVYKLPIALALSATGMTPADTLTVFGSSLETDTWSPMLAMCPPGTATRMPLRSLLALSLQQSDNNASDILLRLAGGAPGVRQFLESRGFGGISVTSSESEMHADNTLCMANSATPLEMARLIDALYSRPAADPMEACIRELMDSCATGEARLPAPLRSRQAAIGHKTGTGFTLPSGRLMAVNDAGHVRIPGVRPYTIVVFVADAGLSLDAAEAVIARISEIVADAMTRRPASSGL